MANSTVAACAEYLPITCLLVDRTFVSPRLKEAELECVCASRRLTSCAYAIIFPSLTPCAILIHPFRFCLDDIKWKSNALQFLDCVGGSGVLPVSMTIKTVQACCGILYPPCFIKNESDAKSLVIALQVLSDKPKSDTSHKKPTLAVPTAAHPQKPNIKRVATLPKPVINIGFSGGNNASVGDKPKPSPTASEPATEAPEPVISNFVITVSRVTEPQGPPQQAAMTRGN